MNAKIGISNILVFVTLMVTYWMQRRLIDIIG